MPQNFNFDDLYTYSKLCFLNSIQKNEIANHIFLSLTSIKKNRLSKSFYQDIKLLEERFGLKIDTILDECIDLKNSMKKSFLIIDGLSDSINTCLKNHKNKKFKIILDNLIKPKFISDEEEFQELLQYFFIMNDSN